jgi:hypothetical protein
MLKPYINLVRSLTIALIQTAIITYWVLKALAIIAWKVGKVVYNVLRIVVPVLCTVLMRLFAWSIRVFTVLFRMAMYALNIIGWAIMIFVGLHLFKEFMKK